MPWVKLTDDFADNPKVARAGSLAIGVWVAGLAYCNRNLTDGFIPRGIAHGLAILERVDEDGFVWEADESCGMVGETVTGERVAEILVSVGLWNYADGGYQVNDFLDYQPSRSDVLGERQTLSQKRAAAGRKGGMARPSKPSKSPSKQPSKEDLLNTPDAASTEGFGRVAAGNSPSKPKQTTSPVPVPLVEVQSQEPSVLNSSPLAIVAPLRPHDAWNAVWATYLEYHPAAKASPKRKRLVAVRLRDGHTLDQLVAAVHGNHRDPFCNGENQAGKTYHGLELILRDADHVERYADIGQAKNGQPRMSAEEMEAKAKEYGWPS